MMKIISLKTPRTASITLDLEQDYGRFDQYDCLKDTSSFEKIIDQNKVHLTVFSTGKIIELNLPILKRLTNLGTVFELHSYFHSVENIPPHQEKVTDIKKAKKCYRQFFKSDPWGYRAPQGIISSLELDFLKNDGFFYDSSIFPSYRPGKFLNLRSNFGPYYLKNSLLEIPVSTISPIRILFTLSYLQFFGFDFYYKLVRRYGFPQHLVFNCHFHNLYPNEKVRELPLGLRLIYRRNFNKGIEIFQNIIKLLKKNHFQFINLRELYLLST